MQQRPTKKRKISPPEPTTTDSEENTDISASDNGSAAGGQDQAMSGPNSKKNKSAWTKSHRSVKCPPLGVASTEMLRRKSETLLKAAKVQPLDQTTKEIIETALKTLKAVIEAIPEHESESIHHAEARFLKSHKIAIPFPQPRPSSDASTKYKVAFAKPRNINVTGSFALQTAANLDGRLVVDLVVTMPKTIFSDKDYLDFRYFYKRAFYLATIAAAVKKSAAIKYPSRFSYMNGNSLHPVLFVDVLIPQSKESRLQKIEIQILLAVEEGTFPIVKTLPDKICVRADALNQESNGKESHGSKFYNASVRSDEMIAPFLRQLYGSSKRSPNFGDACVLGQVWLQNRGFSGSIEDGGFGHFEWAAIMSMLIQGDSSRSHPLLSPSLDSVQLFRATLRFLAIRNLAKDPLCNGLEGLKSQRDKELPMIIDKMRGINILYKMSPWAYRRLQYEAQQSMKMLNDSTIDCFDPLLSLKVEEHFLKYDIIMTVQGRQPTRSDQPHDFARKLYEILNKGLGKRITNFNITFNKGDDWPIHAAHPHSSDELPLILQMNLDPAQGNQSVDRGPPAEDVTGTTLFKEFWGDKSELRRFKDGSIAESVVWTGRTAIEKVSEIVTVLLVRHFELKPGKEFRLLGSDMAEISERLGADEELLNATSENVKSYRNLESLLRNLEGLPLAIRQIRSCGADGLEISEDGGAVVNVIVQFEGSGKWPDDLSAIQMTKVAFLLKLGELISEADSNLKTFVGLENEHLETVNKSYLDVVHLTGVTLRIRIHHERELSLIEKQLKAPSSSSKDKESAAAALSSYRRVFLRKPAQQQAIEILSTRFPAFLPTLGLVKAWFRAHLMAWHFQETLIELLVAHTFINSFPWRTPSTQSAGFLQTLAFLSHWNWHTVPLLVDFNSSWRADDRNLLRTKFEAWRAIDPLMNRIALFVGSTIDDDGITWSDGQPSKVVASRMTSLAKAACSVIYRSGIDLKIESLFKPSLKDYDFFLQISPEYSATSKPDSARGNQKYKNLKLSEDDLSILKVKSQRVNRFVEELRALYGRLILFFHDPHSGEYVAGLWVPDYSQRNWKISLAYSSKPQLSETVVADSNIADDDSEKIDAIINKDSILAEIGRIGGDLISKITVQSG